MLRIGAQKNRLRISFCENCSDYVINYRDEINDEKLNLIKSRIRKNCSPKHVPAIIIKVPEIPRTKSGKIVELAVRQVINGEKINNKEAIANPEALKFYENLPQLKS